MANLIQIGLFETIQLSSYGIKPVRTENFSQSAEEIWIPQATQTFQKVCKAIHPQAFHVHFVIQVIKGQAFGNVDFYAGIPEFFLARWNPKLAGQKI